MYFKFTITRNAAVIKEKIVLIERSIEGVNMKSKTRELESVFSYEQKKEKKSLSIIDDEGYFLYLKREQAQRRSRKGSSIKDEQQMNFEFKELQSQIKKYKKLIYDIFDQIGEMLKDKVDDSVITGVKDVPDLLNILKAKLEEQDSSINKASPDLTESTETRRIAVKKFFEELMASMFILISENIDFYEESLPELGSFEELNHIKDNSIRLKKLIEHAYENIMHVLDEIPLNKGKSVEYFEGQNSSGLLKSKLSKISEVSDEKGTVTEADKEAESVTITKVYQLLRSEQTNDYKIFKLQELFKRGSIRLVK